MSALRDLRRFAGQVARRLGHWSPSAIAHRRRVEKECRERVDEVRPRSLDDSPSFHDYLRAQIERSFPLADAGKLQPPLARTIFLTSLMAEHIPASDLHRSRVLCVGCRDGRELDALESLVVARADDDGGIGGGGIGGDEGIEGRVVGLDLFSSDPRIEVGDMHRMPFEDAAFDLLYSCHSLEHSYDLDKALDEFSRVVRPGGFMMIEVPIQFVPSEADRQDLGSVSALIERLGDSVGEVLFREESSRWVRGIEKRNARLLLRTRSGSEATGAKIP